MDKARLSQKDKLFKPERIDPYHAAMTGKGPAFCGDCGASYQAGRWSWQAKAVEAECITCPACRRIADNAPAGTLSLEGAFAFAHQQDILNLIRRVEQSEKTEHPLERLMQLTPQTDGWKVTTTGTHLATRIAHALEAAYRGELRYRHNDQRQQVDISWTRSA